MTEHLLPGSHPDAEVINAFIEGVLSPHERLECVSHLAECSSCRAIVFLAQPPAIQERRRWLNSIRVLSGALAACLLIGTVSIYRMQMPAAKVTRIEVRPPFVDSQKVENSEADNRSLITKAVPAARASTKPPPAPADAPQVEAKQLPAPLAQSAAADQVASATLSQRAVHQFNFRPKIAVTAGLSEVKVTVSDPAGAPVADARITIHNPNGAAVADSVTDADGKSTVASLPPGKYELQIDKAGFESSSSPIEVKLNDSQALASTLSVGSRSQTVEVTSASSAITTNTARLGSTLQAKAMAVLPADQPVVATNVRKGNRILSVDSAGGLLLSSSAGKYWKPVKPKWHGKVTKLALSDRAANGEPEFQLTTEFGADWLSRDGTHWRLKK